MSARTVHQLDIILKTHFIFAFECVTAIAEQAKAIVYFPYRITDFFSCDPKPECSPNDTFTLQDGGSGKPGVENPNLINIGDAAIEKAENFEESGVESTTPERGMEITWNPSVKITKKTSKSLSTTISYNYTKKTSGNTATYAYTKQVTSIDLAFSF